MKRNNLIMIVVTISMFIVLLLGATYAYFASNTNTGNGLDMTITTDDNNIAFAATEGTLSMHVKAEDMLQSQTGSGDVLAAETIGEDNITITLATNTSTPIACTYNVYFQWNSNQAYNKTTGATKELTLELNLEDEDSTGSEGTNSFASETQISDVVTGTTKTKIVNGAYIIGSSSNSGRQEWIPTVRFYNLAKDQSALAGKTFGGKFTIEDVECNAMVNLSDELVTQSQNSVTASGLKEYTSSQDGTPYVIKHETLQYDRETLDAGIRYEGKDPDNYVVFNGEEWRIIGFFEGSTIGLEPGKQYTKIIRNERYIIKEYDNKGEYDTDGNGIIEAEPPLSINDWEKSTLNEWLNNDYLNGNGQLIKDSWTDVKSLDTSAKNMIAKYNGDYSTLYLRGATREQHQTATTKDWYIHERYTGTVGGIGSIQGDAEPTSKSAIGLMYPSDYGYAAYSADCIESPLSNYGERDGDTGEITGCSLVNWLSTGQSETYMGTEFLMAPLGYSGGEWDYMQIYLLDYGLGAGIVTSTNMFAGNELRPTLYLEANVQIVGGNGSKANPYILS